MDKKYQVEMQERVAAYNAEIAALAADLSDHEPTLLVLAANAHVELDAAVCKDDRPRAQAARRRLQAIAYVLAGRDHSGAYQAEKRIDAHLAPAPGEIPTWGLDGEFLVEVDGIKVRCTKLGAHLSLHAVDVDAAFVSQTGFQSWGFRSSGDVRSATVATIRGLLKENGRHAIRAEHREYIIASQPAWVADAVARAGAGAATYQDGLQMAFAF